MKRKFATMIDNIALSLLVGVLFYCWLNFVSHKQTLCLIAATASALLCFVVCSILSKKRQKKLDISAKTIDNVDRIYQKLLFTETQAQTKWLASHTQNATIFYDFFKQGTTIFCNALLKNKLGIEDVCQFIRKLESVFKNLKDFEIVVLCEDFEKQTKTFVESLNIKVELLNKFETAKKFGLKSETLECNIQILKPEKSFKAILDYALSPKRFRSYFLFGMLLVASSFFVIYQIYYLVFGTLFLFMSALTLILKKKKNTI